jgi:CheY-like chemotaxis protein
LGGLVNIEWRVGGDIWQAFADQTQLELALVNLIINARDAMPDGGTVTIAAENCHVADEEVPGVTAGDFVRLIVRDTGSGIAPELLEKVTEPFFTTKEQGKGSGLGLSMVYGFAKQSNGAFRIESELGQGTVAELWLPRAPAKPAAEPKPPAKRKRREPVRKMTILLVDDHAEVRSTTAAVLSEQGHQVVEAVDGKEALKALRSRECDYDLLISDYAMPHLSGAEFVREARTLCPDVPALIITGYAEAQAVSGRPDGVEILLKPFTEGALEAAIARACSASPVAG